MFDILLRFLALGSSVKTTISEISDSLRCIRDSTGKFFLVSRLHKQEFLGFPNPDSLTGSFVYHSKTFQSTNHTVT